MNIETFARSDAAAIDETTGELRRLLSARRQELFDKIQSRIRDLRAEASGQRRPTTDPGETTEVEAVDDIAFVLLQMQSQALNRIDLAIQRIDEGSYGVCADCMNAIARSRLRALPFAVRCKDCEEARECSAGGRATRPFQHEGVVDTFVQ